MFIFITILSTAAIILGLSWYEYKGLNKEEKEFKDIYFSWLFSKKAGFNPKLWKKKGLDFYNRRFVQAYPANQRWIFLCLAASFLYLSLSGFIFALFVPGRIQGVFLMLHMIAGGVFGMALGAVVVLRARYHYIWGESSQSSQVEIDRVLVRIFFWVFVLSGLLLIVSALSMMMPFFSMPAQLQLFGLHQYSALAAVLAAFAFLYLTADDT